jgi:ATP-dependent DNA helicase UvrD/PcrA
MTIDAVLSALTREQRAAATRTGPVLVLAGAGTGKTRTLTAAVAHRIAACGVPPEMLTRIRAALGEHSVPRWIGTFHGLAARQLRTEPEIAGLRAGFDILDADDSKRVMRRVLRSLNLAGGEEGVLVDRDPLKVMCNRIARFKDSLVTPEEAPARIEAAIAEADRDGLPVNVAELRATAQAFAAYQRSLRDGNAADFGDLLLWPARAMQAKPDYRVRWAARFDCVLSDEYQDVNHAQYTWLRLLCDGHGQVFVVGDDDQAVYSWRGADIRYIRRFTRDFPDAVQVRLEENFRSTGHILDAANAVIARDPARLGKTLFTQKARGDRIEIVRFQNAEAEAAGLVAEIGRRHAEGLAWDEIAILYRGNALSRPFEEALMRARMPYMLVGDVGFWQRAEIKDALAFLRIATRPDDVQSDEALRRVINVPARGFGARALEALELEAAWRQVSLMAALETADLPAKARSAGLAFGDAIRNVGKDARLSLADQLSALLDVTGYRAMLRDSRAEVTEDRLENLQELIGLAGGFHTARELLDQAALSTGGPDEGETGRLRLMTLHKGKGLEFAHIFLPAWEEGTFPPTYGDLSEERRLAYVAITRGMRRVTISHCAYRRGHASPSRFLEDIPEQHRVLGWLRGPGPSARPPIRAPQDRAALLHPVQRQRRDLRS